MKFSKRFGCFFAAARSAVHVLMLSTATITTTMVFAQTPALPTAADAGGRVDAPDGAPTLAAEKGVDSRTVAATAREATSLSVSEERIQGRLANARVSVGGGRAYTVVDPSAGRFDRQADNAGRHVAPALWELFRF